MMPYRKFRREADLLLGRGIEKDFKVYMEHLGRSVYHVTASIR
jgi:hypothetical protein